MTEEYISAVSDISGVCISTAVGNESDKRHHTDGALLENEDTQNIEIRVPENSYGFYTHIWNNPSDRFSVSVKSPTNEVIERVTARAGTTLEANLETVSTTVIVQYFFPMIGSGSQMTVVKLIDPAPGIWTITVYGDIVLDGTYHAWLPITGVVTPGVEFVRPTPNYTVTPPSTSTGSIACGAYNSRTDILYDESSWGPTRLPSTSPDIVAPGVEVLGVYPNDVTGTMTGTSVATSMIARCKQSNVAMGDNTE
jgi:hypothetical protein